jgi:hypothetical protein
MSKLEIKGLIRGESNNDYHNNAAVSSSKLKVFMTNPLSYQRRYITRETGPQETTVAMSIGSLAHAYILERGTFFDRHMVLPKTYTNDKGETKPWSGNATVCKEIIAAAEAAGKEVLTEEEFKAVKALSVAVDANPVAQILLAGGEAELTWRVDYENFSVQSRTDYFVGSATEEQSVALQAYGIDLQAGEPYIVDLKTTADLSSWERTNYGSALVKYGYHLQTGFYRPVVNTVLRDAGIREVEKFFFVVIDKGLEDSCVFVLDDETMLFSTDIIEKAVGKLQQCYATNAWPGYKDRGVVKIGVPEHIRRAVLMQDVEGQDIPKQDWLTRDE